MRTEYPKKNAKKNGFGEPVEPFGGAVDEQTQAQVDNLNEELKKPFYPGITPVVDSESKSNEEPSQTRYTGYDDIYNMLQEAKNQNERNAEDASRRSRLAKAHEAIGGIYDLGRAIANLYGTTQYAPNINMESMSDKARERYDKAVAEREGYKDAAMNYLLQGANIKARQEAAQQAQKNFERTQKRLEEQEQRRKDEFEFKQQKEQWRQDFEKEKLDQKAQLAKMNADLKRWSEKLKMSRSEVAHSLAGYTIDEYVYIDEQGRNHKVKVRTVYNPKTEQLESEQTDEVQQTSQQTTQQSGGKTPPSRRQNNNDNTNTPPSRRKK